MRWIVTIVMLVVAATACGGGEGGAIFCLRDGELHEPGDFFPAGDGCNFCACESDGDIMCSTEICNDDGGIRDDGGGIDLCSPNGFCSDGVECNGQCCGPGERCDQGICTCGGGFACSQQGNGDICATGGPIGPDSCGSTCCGVTQPCPL